MSKTGLECRQVILKNLTQMNPGSETLTYSYSEKKTFSETSMERAFKGRMYKLERSMSHDKKVIISCHDSFITIQ